MCMPTTDRQTVNNYSSPHPRANLLQFEYIINGIKVAETVYNFKLSAIALRKFVKSLYNSKTYIHHYMFVCYALQRYNADLESQH